MVQGDYTVKITDAAEDNLGGLATSLNRMTQTLDASFSALEKRNQELDQFAYVASHDLKAPLRGVTTIVKWIEEELAAELSPQLRTYLDQMKGRLQPPRRPDQRPAGLRPRGPHRADRARPVDVGQLLREVGELVVPPDFTLHIGPDLPTFVTDRLSLQQVFTNLLSNAVKYHQRGRRPPGRDLPRRWPLLRVSGAGRRPRHCAGVPPEDFSAVSDPARPPHGRKHGHWPEHRAENY